MGEEMTTIKYLMLVAGSACALAFAAPAFAENFNIPSGDLKAALNAYAKQTGLPLLVSDEAVRGAHTKGVKGDLSPDDALSRLLLGTGFVIKREASAIGIVRGGPSADEQLQIHLAAAPALNVSGAALETVTVTSSKIGGDVQNIPISITALSQEQLTATQTTGGPDL